MTKPIVFKLGGEALLQSASLQSFLEAVKNIQLKRPVLIVHGGGPQVESMMAAAGITSQKVDGIRATPVEHLPFVIGSLAGVASQQLLGAAKQAGLNPVALSLADGVSFECKKIDASLGAVGQVRPKNRQTLDCLLGSNHLVIVNSIGCDEDGNSLNINADDAAVAVAQLLDAELVLLSNVSGVLSATKQLLSELNRSHLDKLINQGVISDGMVVKVNAAYQAAQCLRRPVNIGNWQDASALHQLHSSSNINLGTRILPE